MKDFFTILASSFFLLSGVNLLGLELGPGGEPKEIIGGINPIAVYIVYHETPVLDAPNAKGKILNRASFLEPYYLARGPVKGKGGQYVLLAEAGSATDEGHYRVKRLIGWAPADRCLIGRNALKTQYGIYRKALIVTDPGRLKSTDGISNLSSVKVLKGPGKRSDGKQFDEVTQIGLYDFFYMYQEIEKNGQKYALLGDRPSVVSHRSPQEAILGWVEEGRIFRWDTRQAIEFHKENLLKRIAGLSPDEMGVKVFATDKELKFWLKGIKTPPGAKEPLQPIAEEDTKVPFWRYNWPRYPILSSASIGRSRTGKVFKIGFIGDMLYVDSSKKGLTAGKVAEAVQTIDQIKGKLRNIDLFFVIDSTGSMRRYFPAAGKAVQTITKQLNASFSPSDSNRPKIRYSVLFYRDYIDEQIKGSYVTKRLPFTEDATKVVKFLVEESAPPNGAGGDEPEAVFHGIYTAVDAAAEEVRDFSSRAVVLIGDKGNHPEDVRGYDIVKITKFLRDHDVDFYGIHVVNNKQLLRQPDAQLFQDQVQIINAQLQMPTNTSYFARLEPEEVAESIVQAIKAIGKDSSRMQKIAEELRRGRGMKELKKQYGLRLTERFSRMMEKAGLDPDAFVKSSVQVFGEGWISENQPKNGLPQIKEVLLVNRADYEILVGFLAGFVRQQATRQNIRKLWNSVLKANLGEFDTKKTVAELIQNHLGLPVRKKILFKTLDQISNLSAKEIATLYEDLSNDLRLMRGVLAEQNLSIEKVNGKTQIKRIGFHRYWWEAHGQEFAWIPLSLMP